MKARSYQANIIPITDWTKRRKQRTFFLASDRFSIFFPYWWCECCAVCASSLLIPLVNNKSITNDNPCAFSHCQAHLFPSCLCNGVWWMCHYFDVWVWNLAARKCVFSHWACVCVCVPFPFEHWKREWCNHCMIFHFLHLLLLTEYIRNVNTRIVCADVNVFYKCHCCLCWRWMQISLCLQRNIRRDTERKSRTKMNKNYLHNQKHGKSFQSYNYVLFLVLCEIFVVFMWNLFPWKCICHCYNPSSPEWLTLLAQRDISISLIYTQYIYLYINMCIDRLTRLVIHFEHVIHFGIRGILSKCTTCHRHIFHHEYFESFVGSVVCLCEFTCTVLRCVCM